MTIEKLTKINVSEIMEKDYRTVHPDTTISKAIGIMRKYKQFELPVVSKNGILKGLLSYSSLIRTGRVTMNEKVETQQTNIPRLKVGDSVARAAELFLSSDYRLLPITKNKKVEGVVKRCKIIELSSDLTTWRDMKVTELMSKNIEFVNLHDHLDNARTILRRLDVRTIPVVDENEELVGVIGISDIITYLKPKQRQQQGTVYGERTHFDPKVKDVMIETPQYLSKDSTVSNAIAIMLDKNISTVIIVEERKPIGIITGFDILENIVAAREEQKGVFVNISGLEDEAPEVIDILFEILESEMKRINKIFTLKVLNIHIRTYNIEGTEVKYSVHMRLTTDKYLFTTKSADWDLFKAFAEAVDRLYTLVVKKKEMTKNYKGK